MPIVVSELHVYPIKSCAGTALSTARIAERGIAYDRGWLLTDESGKMLTQRDLPRMALIKPTLLERGSDEPSISLQAPEMPSLTVTPLPDGRRTTVTVWEDDCQAIDEGDRAAVWFSEYLKTKCRLVRVAPDDQRKAYSRYGTADSARVAFADEYPLLVISQASLNNLNERLGKPVPMNRFRPNIVVTGCDSFAEDDWRSIRIGSVEFLTAKLCARCVITTIDQATTEKSQEPLQTLSKFRNQKNKLMFGQNLLHKGAGEISVGDEVSVLN